MKYPKILGVVLMLAVVLSACSTSATPTTAPIDTLPAITDEPMETASPEGTGTAETPSTGDGTTTPSTGGTSGTPSTGGTAGVPVTGETCDTVTVQLASEAEGTSGSSSTGSMATTGTGTPSTGTTPVGTAVAVAEDYLADCNGMALYVFMDDTPNSGSSSCNDECATEWPPLTISDDESPMAGEGVDESLLSTITRDDGTTQVTYNGWPLYLYDGDSMAGEPLGAGEGDKWFLIDANGNPIQQ